MGKAKYLFLGKENFYILNDSLEKFNQYENNGIFDPYDLKNPVMSVNSLSEKIGEIINHNSISAFIIPDISFNSFVIEFESLPFSLQKREEVIKWKLNSLLPYSVDSYQIKYSRLKGKKLLIYCLPVSIYNSVNQAIEACVKGCWDIVPESVVFAEKLPSSAENKLVFINRKHYYTALYKSDGEIIYIRTRKKVEAIPFDEEIKTVKSVLYEKTGMEANEILICGENPQNKYKEVFGGFNFED